MYGLYLMTASLLSVAAAVFLFSMWIFKDDKKSPIASQQSDFLEQ